jgi:hypothetical protein
MSNNQNHNENRQSEYYGVGSGRRKVLDTLDKKPPLDAVESVESLEDLCDSLAAISVGEYMSPPTDVLEKIKAAHDDLPDEAKDHYVNDEILLRRLNAARNQFETYRGRLRRVKEMPSPVEAGPANYPADRARRRTRSMHKSREALSEKLDKVKAAAGGAKQRALDEIGTSLGEHNEAKREARRDEKRQEIEEGILVAYRNPRYHIGEVIRVNQKSVRVKRSNPRAGQEKPMSDELEPEFIESRIDLDSEHLTPLDTDEAVAGCSQNDVADLTTVEEARTAYAEK